MRELALHLLDIAENSVAAQARAIQIRVLQDSINDRLILSVTDDGKGMDPEMVARVCDPFVTSRTTRKVGLGIPLLKAAAEACNGSLHIQSTLGLGTHVEVEFQTSHIDRMPLGDLAGTFLSLWISYPTIHWTFQYRVDEAEFLFDDSEITPILGDINRSEPEILGYVRQWLQNGVAEVERPPVQYHDRNRESNRV